MNVTEDVWTNSTVTDALSLSSVCSLCGGPVGAERCCTNCVAQVFDLALSGGYDNPLIGLDKGELADEEYPTLRYGHYEICLTEAGKRWELGSGAMGVTYKAFDTDLHRLVALKFIHPAILEELDVEGRFQREARSLAQLRHSNIATIFLLGHTTNGGYFYAMEYIEGESLEERVRRAGPLPPTQALEIILQIAGALAAAAEQGIVHRDIKPGNIMLASSAVTGDTSLNVKLIDFGVAKAINAEEELGTYLSAYFVGTPHYASPEQIHEGWADARSDLYSLGRCLEFMLGEATTAPQSVNRLICSLVADDPADRLPTAEALRKEVQACLQQARAEYDPSRNRFMFWKAEFGFGRFLSSVGAALILMYLAFGIWSHMRPTPAARPQEAVRSSLEAPAKARLSYARGEEYRKQLTAESNRKAITEYKQALTLHPEFADAHAGLALAYYQEFARYSAPAMMLDLAIASAQDAIALDAKNPRGHHALAAVRAFQDRPWDALLELRKALEADSNYLPAARDFAALWTIVGKPQFALRWAERSIELEPTNLSGYDIAGDAYSELEEDAKAEECAQHCLKIDPAWLDAHLLLMHVHLLQKNYLAARSDFAAYEAIQQDSIESLSLLGQVALFSGSYTEAETIYRRLLKMDRRGMINLSGSISYLSALGLLRLRAGDANEGNALLLEASQMHLADTNGPQALYDLAAIRCIQGHKEKALTLLEHAVNSGWLDGRSPRVDPRFEALREEPRFKALMSQLGIRVAQMREESQELSSKPLILSDYVVQVFK